MIKLALKSSAKDTNQSRCGGARRRWDYQTETAAHIKTFPSFDGETEDAIDAAVTRCICFSSRSNSVGLSLQSHTQIHTCRSHMDANNAPSTGSPLFNNPQTRKGGADGSGAPKKGGRDGVLQPVCCVWRWMLSRRRGGGVWESTWT